MATHARAAQFVRSRSPARSRSREHRHHHHHHKHHRVGDIVAHRETAICQNTETLGDACDAMISTGRTAAVIVDRHGEVCGVLTENDLLAALNEGCDRDLSIDLWLRGGSARLPSCIVPSLTLTPKAALVDAAQIMATEAEKDSGFACHHLVVSHPPHKPRLLSALDIARGMIGDPKDRDEAHAAHKKVKRAMKTRDNMCICKLSDKLIDAYRVMCESRQNCVLVVEGLGDVDGETLVSPDQQGSHIHGVITAADALRTFSECQNGVHTTVAGWLRGLTAEEHPTAPQRSILETQKLSEAAELMTETGVHHLVVLGEHKRDVVGVLSALDIACALGSHHHSGSQGKSGGA
eukprot:gb/GFBE01061475.1/.p1 GENE.gb/GFBE01061475.1/~~gb/GFBE01061475.1/.p1  ORF type:complete len:350 (+),score=59.45 gb/GFBE01061475.1/:1-1050(+)